MYCVVVTNKTLAPFTDMMPEMLLKFPESKFSIWGSEDQGYQFRVEGSGDEKGPRKFALAYLKTWQPKPIEIEE